jgi:hypothetical protein
MWGKDGSGLLKACWLSRRRHEARAQRLDGNRAKAGAGADRQGKPWAYVAYETNGEGWVYREFIRCY